MEQKIKEEKVRREQKEAQESKIRSQASGLMWAAKLSDINQSI